ncbi:MAG: YHS domain-containing protein [Candidatus Brocadia sinica]|uniref:TRASH domain-containing protein n=1 Tax=Candidatus Brocadia sinica JPN1 TaxID=1197129 RepID=A0ABQ0K322_9BACT|nr:MULTISPECIES: YHS domain-containing protein [Brocadia]MCK6469456.1 YHS domain-containing protein [Candidatus Brocadia sinica]GAN35313.1 hypothetical protein BROSI_A3862 [Candidatus Brocadia sinica JPN1]GIK12308.1 MAG: hypothetical protein BroJett002_10150 [Candidatus Brocadia sinica]GJQ18302.1 MAG: hypothetical protein HBSIN01_22610 [Candidatus Brocadia sinica]
MNSILRTALVITCVVGFHNMFIGKTLWACAGCNEVGEYPVQKKTNGKSEKAETVKDPVCGMEVSDIKKAPREEYNGKVYYFCAEHCKKIFKKDPGSYRKEKP